MNAIGEAISKQIIISMYHFYRKSNLKKNSYEVIFQNNWLTNKWDKMIKLLFS